MELHSWSFHSLPVPIRIKLFNFLKLYFQKGTSMNTTHFKVIGMLTDARSLSD